MNSPRAGAARSVPTVVRVLVIVLALAGVLASGWAESTSAAPTSTNRVLTIEPSFTRVSGAKATLTIEPLRRTSGVIFAGDYQVKVSPFFFKSESGKLAINISNEAIEKAAKGEAVEIDGTATTEGEAVVRPINALATPVDAAHGKLKIWFVADGREMVFHTQYRLSSAKE